MRLRPDHVVTPDDLARGKRALVKDAAWASLVGALYGGVILVGFALELGATPFLIGLLAAIPFFAQFAQLPAIALVERVRERRRIAVKRIKEGREHSERQVIQQFAAEAVRSLDQLSPIEGLRGAILFPFGRLAERRRQPRT
jgi:hypothetical protein